MTKFKKVLTIMLVFVLVLTLSPIRVNATKKKKVKLNKSKLSMYIGKSYKLKLENNKKKVKWSSSKKKVASVSSKGKVKAKKKGSCKITAKVGKKKYVCKVTVKKKANSSANNNSSNDNSSDTNNNSSSEDNTIKYIADRSVTYDSANSEFRILFSLKNSVGTRLNSSGYISAKIVNDDNVEVYNKTMRFSPKNFENWTSPLLGTKYLCCAKIKKVDILPSTTAYGKLYFDVSLDNGIYFAETAYRISALPELTDKDDSGNVQNECKLELPELPNTFSRIYNRTGHIYSKCTVNNIEYEFSRKISGKYDLKITFDVTKVYDEDGDNGTTSISFLAKLYLDNSIIDSTTCTKLTNIVNSQSCSISETFSDLEPGNYRLELVDHTF